MLAYLTGEIKKSEILHPVIVVHHLGSIGLVTFKVQKLSHLLLDALLVVIKSIGIQQVSFLTLTRWITNHTRSTTHQDDGLVATTLEMPKHHDTAQMANVQ